MTAMMLYREAKVNPSGKVCLPLFSLSPDAMLTRLGGDDSFAGRAEAEAKATILACES